MKRFGMNMTFGATAGAVVALMAMGAAAETRVTYKSAKSTSSYYQMAVQISQAIKAGTGGKISVTVEESQGSVQNVREAAKRGAGYIFTTPPVLVKLAMAGKAMFKKKDPAYQEIRSLFPIPSLTMHFVVRADSGAKTLTDLKGKRFIIGKGSFGAREAAKYFKLFGVEVATVKVELNAAVPALKNGQVDGFATAGSWPAPNVMEAAAGTKIRVLSLTDEQIKATKRTRLVIPKGTYPGIDQDIVTTSLPVVAYTTTKTSEETAYLVTKAYWQQKEKMGKTNPWWNGVTPMMLANVIGKLHPGALRYYQEKDIGVPDSLK